MSKSTILHTQWGNATLNKDGYFHITSGNQENKFRLLHRLVYEDFWGITLPQEIVIHHKDGNKRNNCILNLEAMYVSEHCKIHNHGENNSFYGKKHSENSLELMSMERSKSTNTTGYYRVFKHKSNSCKQGFLYRYCYFAKDNTRKYISSVNIGTLKEKVLAKGLPWIELLNFSAEASE